MWNTFFNFNVLIIMSTPVMVLKRAIINFKFNWTEWQSALVLLLPVSHGAYSVLFNRQVWGWDRPPHPSKLAHFLKFWISPLYYFRLHKCLVWVWISVKVHVHVHDSQMVQFQYGEVLALQPAHTATWSQCWCDASARWLHLIYITMRQNGCANTVQY